MASLIDLVVLGAAIAVAVRVGLLAVVARKLAPSRRPPTPEPDAPRPGITILRPMRGLDAGAAENLAALAALTYPGPVQIVVGVTDPDDPALPLAMAFRAAHPTRRITIVVGDAGAATNPKVANLVSMTEAAAHELLVVSDANVRVAPDYLERMLAHMRATAADMVANPIAVEDGHGAAARLESLQLAGTIAAAVCASELVRHTCVIGKSVLLRRGDLTRLGGWARFADVLGEDYLMGRAWAGAGMRVAIAPMVVRTRLGPWTLAQFMARHLRWCQMRRWIAPGAYALEPLLMPLPWLGATIALTGERASGLAALLAALAVLLGESWQQARLTGGRPSATTLALVPIRDALMLAIWLAAWFVRGVTWRGHAFRIGPGSRLTAIDLVDDEPLALPQR